MSGELEIRDSGCYKYNNTPTTHYKLPRMHFYFINAKTSINDLIACLIEIYFTGY